MEDKESLTTKSTGSERWMFNEVPPGTVGYVQERFDSYALEGRVLFSRDQQWPSVLSVHGARSDYTKMNGLLYRLQERGISSLGFNLSGHSPASGIALQKTSLANNLAEAKRFFGYLHEGPCAVIGHSLGGALAIKLAMDFPNRIKKIVLFCPALYADAAYECSFGDPFKSAISLPYSFQCTDSFDFLRGFDGRVMLVIGQYDGLRSTDYGGLAGTSAGFVTVDGVARYSPIPHEVVDSIKNSVAASRLVSLTINGCDHGISAWFRNHPTEADLVAHQVAHFLEQS